MRAVARCAAAKLRRVSPFFY